MKLAKKLGVLSLAAIGALSLGLGVNSHINNDTNVDYGTVTYGENTYSTTTYETTSGTQEIITIDNVDYLLPQITTVNNSTALNSAFGLVIYTDSVSLTLNDVVYYDIPLTVTISQNIDSDGDLNTAGSTVVQNAIAVNVYLDMSSTTYTYVTETGPSFSSYDNEYELALYYGISENQSTSFNPSNAMTYEYKYAQYVATTETLQWQIMLPYALWSYDFFLVNETDYDYSYTGASGNAGNNGEIKAITTNYMVDDSLDVVMWHTVASNEYVSTLDYSDLLPHYVINSVEYDDSYEYMTLNFDFYGNRFDLDYDGTSGSVDTGNVIISNIWFLFDYINSPSGNVGQETGTEIGYAVTTNPASTDSVLTGTTVGPANDHKTNVEWKWYMDGADATKPGVDVVLLDAAVSSLAVWDTYFALDTNNIRTTTQKVDLTTNGLQDAQVDDYSINYNKFDVKLSITADTNGNGIYTDSTDVLFFAPSQAQYFSSLKLAPAVDDSMEAWAITLIVWGSAVLTVALIVIGMNAWERHKKYGSMFSSKYSWMHAHHVNEKIVLTNKDTGEVIEMERDL